MLFGATTKTQVRVMMQVIQKFCSASGEKVSLNKSEIFVSSNIHSSKAKALSRVARISLIKDLSKYLGAPMLHGRVTKATYSDLCNKVGRKLEQWSNKFLSMAGRVSLVQAVSSTMASYIMQTTLLPDSVAMEIDKLNRNFIWGQAKSSDSYTWRSILKSRGVLAKGLGKVVNNGLHTNFWLDSWLPCGPLINFTVRDLSPTETELPVACFCDEYGNWDLDSLIDILPMQILQKLESYPIDPSSTEKDKCFWTLTSSGEFSVKSAYESESTTNLAEHNKLRLVWCLSSCKKVKMFIWCVLHESLPTAAWLMLRKLGSSSTCSRCNNETENLIHALHDYPASRDTWLAIKPNLTFGEFFVLDLQAWIQLNMSGNGLHDELPESGIFIHTIWMVWH
ncbi:Non-LTR retroelement reverse transcriptase-like protein [Theobroma cacao]|uniref:Non-LTR retroelement reverse transcriptase-like protein n=1 Tax=Theobroma cacao TaxID=3641 RepID=A0A061EHZ3_THECC|nr:Non-LTR retroelement reverse transcriptase-like protein [Theobroma cacao]